MTSDTRFIVLCEKVPNTNKYYVRFPYNKQLVEKIKSLPIKQRSWNPSQKAWEISPAGLFSVILAYRNSKIIFFDFMGEENKKEFINLTRKEDEKAKKKILELKNQLEKNDLAIKFKKEYEQNPQQYADKVLKNLKNGVTLFNHQIVAALFLEYVGSALISFEMGLGKTLVSIAFVEMKGFDKVFVITPNSLKFNYFNEIKKFTDSKAYIIGNKNNEYSIEESKYIIFNYEFFNKSNSDNIKNKLKNLGLDFIPKCVICDESHKLKNSKSNTYKNFKKLFKKVEHKVFLSGTPAPNRIYELYTTLNQISPIEFATKKHFFEYYCGMVFNTELMTWETNNLPKLDELYNKLSAYTYRKRKEEVLDLPDKIYQKIFIEMDKNQLDEYKEIEKGVVEEIIFGNIHQTQLNPLTVLIRLRQYTAKQKIKMVAELLERLVEEDEKIVVIDMFKENLYEINKLFPTISAVHTGDQSVEERNTIVSKFQDPNSDLKLFLGSIQTCSYGLTLTASNKIFIITLPFSVGEYDQVSDRCILSGQLVLTKNDGYKKIENIKIGDLVYTHKGNWKKVLDVKSKLEKKKALYKIYYKGYHLPLSCTQDHKLYVYDKIKKSYEWVEASNINIFDHMIVLSKLNIGNNTLNEFNIDYIEEKIGCDLKFVNRNIKLDNKLLYAMGRFIGDGWVNENSVCISGRIDEDLEVKRCIEYISDSFGLNSTYDKYFKSDKKYVVYTIFSKDLRDVFEFLFGETAKNKKIPELLFNLKHDLIKSLLDGIYSTNGYKRKGSQQVSRISKYLSYQIILLESLIGNIPRIKQNNSNKRYSSWSLEYGLNDMTTKNKFIINDNGNLLFSIAKIEIVRLKRGNERVYDLTVEDDHSFVVGLSTVHNCHRIGQKNNVTIYIPQLMGTIDEKVFELIENKRKEISKAIDNVDFQSKVSESILNDLIGSLKKKYVR